MTSTEDVIAWWKEHFEELLNPMNLPSTIETELEDDGGSTSNSLKEVTQVVKQLSSYKAPGINGIHPEMLKALSFQGLSWMIHLFNIA